MPPIQLKGTPASAQTLTQEARDHVREAMRTTLASSASSSGLIPLTEAKFGPKVEEFAPGSINSRVLCCEEIDGRRWNYVVGMEGSRGLGKVASSLRSVSLRTPMTPADELMSFVRSYVVPEGFPDSVTPSYVPYMTWRALKHFFGGAMGVFTTQTLLSSVGVSKNRATPGAVAINWILKDSRLGCGGLVRVVNNEGCTI